MNYNFPPMLSWLLRHTCPHARLDPRLLPFLIYKNIFEVEGGGRLNLKKKWGKVNATIFHIDVDHFTTFMLHCVTIKENVVIYHYHPMRS